MRLQKLFKPSNSQRGFAILQTPKQVCKLKCHFTADTLSLLFCLSHTPTTPSWLGKAIHFLRLKTLLFFLTGHSLFTCSHFHFLSAFQVCLLSVRRKRRRRKSTLAAASVDTFQCTRPLAMMLELPIYMWPGILLFLFFSGILFFDLHLKADIFLQAVTGN